ncbi:MAG TPA: ATP-binding protein [Pyrinomonadaceae bacterium]|nr:ATP-binding protein [Pyrinomonadaceae bacterium]
MAGPNRTTQSRDGAGAPSSATTLRTVADTVRRVMRSDTASVASFSLTDKTITWKAMSGFHSRAEDAPEAVTTLQGEFAERLALVDDASIIEVKSVAGGLPASEFPLHSVEGVVELALVPLWARGEALGVLAVGYRAPHRLSAQERQLLDSLAEMAALALDNARLLETVGAAKRIWEQTFDAIPDGIIVHDEEMRIARCNREAAEMMGFDGPADAIGVSCSEAFARLFGERAAAYHMSRRVGATTSFELQAEDGRRYLVSIAPLQSLESGVLSLESDDPEEAQPNDARPSTPEQTGSQTSNPEPAYAQSDDTQPREEELRTQDSGLSTSSWSVITWSDITELSEIQEQLARSRRLATVGQIAAGVAHEINNPLAAITTCAEAVQRGLRTEPASAALAEERQWNFYLEEIVRQALRCKSITRGLLDLSRQRRARREACDINALVMRAVKAFEPRGRERGVRFALELDARVGEVATDEAMLRQVLDNLLSNALDAVPDGGLVSTSTALHGERVAIEVADDGPGIPPELLARIFDPFFTTKEAGKGSGLGLAISNTLAEAVGGALTVETRHGSGSRFRLWIPRRMPEKQ